MPAKRPSPGSASEPAAKMTRTGTASNSDATVAISAAAPRPRNPRWSRVSASANVDISYHERMDKDPAKAFSFVCMCRPLFEAHGDDDDEDEYDEDDDNDAESNERNKRCCADGKPCVNGKPAAEHPDHPYVITYAGQQKYMGVRTLCDLRAPDCFDMYTFNDHEGYGVLEVLQNLILDYKEAADHWKEQWAVCETIAQMCNGVLADPLMQIDDSEGVFATYSLIGRMFLNMLDTLCKENHLTPNSQVKDLPLVMSHFITFVHDLDSMGFLRGENTLHGDPYATNKFSAYVLSYARKYNITLPLEAKYTADLEEVDVPAQSRPNDAWWFHGALTQYAKMHARSYAPGKAACIGGDSLDITTWTSAKRRESHFEHKDPLGKKELDAIKQGMVLHVG